MSLVWLGNIRVTDNATALTNAARGGLLLLTPGEVDLGTDGWMDDDVRCRFEPDRNFERESMISRLKDKKWNETRSLARSPLRHVDLQYLDLIPCITCNFKINLHVLVLYLSPFYNCLPS